MTTKKRAVATKPKTKRRNPLIEGFIEGLMPPGQLAIREQCLKLADRLAAALRAAGDYDRALPILKGLRKATAKWVRIKDNR